MSPLAPYEATLQLQKVLIILLRCHSVQGLYGTHPAGIAICPDIHLPVRWILYNPCTG